MSLPVLLRAFALVLSVLFAAQATGATEAFFCCTDECPEDEDEVGCPPGCSTCLCSGPRLPGASMARVGAPKAVIVPALAAPALLSAAPAAPTPKAPGHVPRDAKV